MRVLIVGGTSFVGRAIAWSAWHHGHEVTVINRGVTANDLPGEIERLIGDRRGDLSALAARSFDATVDAIAYEPGDVERLARVLADRGGHYVQISSISAYADTTIVGATEDDLTLWPDGGDTYGPLKAACERAGWRQFGERSTMVRPTYVIGSFDATLRFPYWVERVRRGGEVAVPGPRENFMQYIDARDLAEFVVRVVDANITGAFHVAGPEPHDHFFHMVEQVAQRVAPPGTTLVEVSPQAVREAELDAKLPLWSPTSDPLLALDSSHAAAHGLDLRPLDDSVDDVVAWWGDREWPARWLDRDAEARLLRQ